MAQLRALKDKCVLPDTQKPYIKSITAGADISIEGFQVNNPVSCFIRPNSLFSILRANEVEPLKNGYTHMVVTEFDTMAHRDYYAKTDPLHLSLGASLPPFVKGLQVLDIAI